jgi:glucosamine--fructose-6-phosphate aminotransferase (isomerizing)
MCGIVAYAGKRREAGKIIFEGLKILEYRGYDSWGIATVEPKLTMVKRVGKINRSAFPENLRGTIGLGHTRWATHGAVSEKNAHPHLSQSKRLVLVHNGIVENYLALKNDLVSRGFTFSTATDTEVIANLIEDELDKGLSPQQAVARVLKRLVGRNAFVVFDRREKTLIGARNGSPMILGLGDDEYFLASDPTPFAPHTNRVILLDNGELAVIANGGYTVINAETNALLNRSPKKLTYSLEKAEKGEFPHFYIKEASEQPETLRRAVNQNQQLIRKALRTIKDSNYVYLTGAGTAGRVAMTGSYLFAKLARIRTSPIVSSEFHNFARLVNKNDLLIAISQSGETADTLEAIEAAKSQGARILSIVNVEGSSIVREADVAIPMKVGPERAVASTKAVSAPIAILTLLAFGLAGKLKAGEKLIDEVAAGVSQILDPANREKIKNLAKKLSRSEHLYVIGRDLSYPVALEGAVKLQELPYIHAEGIAGAELKHYAITLIEEGTPCLVLVPNDESRDLILSNATEISARGGLIIGISPEEHAIFDYHLEVPDLGEFGSPIINLVPMQLLAYYLTLERGHDPDYCRNLAKSVTVK